MYRAFVVQLTVECDARQTLKGRVEHVRSGKAIHFGDLDQLVEFFARSMASDKQLELQEEDSLES